MRPRKRKTQVLYFMCLSHTKGQSIALLGPVNPTVNAVCIGLSAVKIFSLIPVMARFITHNIPLFWDPMQNAAPLKSTSASIFCSSCPDMLFVNIFGKYKGKSKVSYSARRTYDESRVLSYPTVPQNKMLGIKISPS